MHKRANCLRVLTGGNRYADDQGHGADVDFSADVLPCRPMVYGGRGGGKLKRLKHLGHEKRRLNQPVVDLGLGNYIIHEALGRSLNTWTTRDRRVRQGVACRARTAVARRGASSCPRSGTFPQVGPDAAGVTHPRSGGNADLLWLFPNLHLDAREGTGRDPLPVYRPYWNDGLSVQIKKSKAECQRCQA